jgi:hypothetical protein
MTKSLRNTTENRKTERARSDVLRRAQAEGVKPFASLADYAGEPEMTKDFDVDVFLNQIREDRDRHSSQGR